jgi:hypothetical protein
LQRRLAVTVLAAALAAAMCGLAAAQTPEPTAPPATPLAIARCIWSALPDRTRAVLVASGPSIEDIGKAVADMNPALMQLAQSQCPPPATPEIEAASKDAWAGTVMTHWAEGELTARYGVSPAALAAAWSRVPPGDRRQIAAGFDKTPEAVRANVTGLAAALRLTDPAALDLLSAWAIAEIRLSALN